MMNYNLKNNGVFLIQGELLKGVSFKKVKQSLRKELRQVCPKIEQRALQKAKNQYLVSYFHQLQSNSGLAQFVGNREAYLGDYRVYKTELEKYDNITLKQVKDECFAMLKSKRPITLSVWSQYK